MAMHMHYFIQSTDHTTAHVQKIYTPCRKAEFFIEKLTSYIAVPNSFSYSIHMAEQYKNKQDSRSQQKYDENGEPILAEGISNHENVCGSVYVIWMSLAMVFLFLFFLALPFTLILGIYFGRKASRNWRLYLTPNGIHHTQVAVLLPCCYKKIFIPLTDVEDIVVKQYVNVHATTIQVRITNESLLEEYTPFCRRVICGNNNYVEFCYVENAAEFTAAVKQQLSAGAFEHE